MSEDYEIIDLGDEGDFVWSFESPEHLFEYLKELHEEHQLIEIDSIKQAFLNQKRDFFYMECLKFEEIYLNNES